MKKLSFCLLAYLSVILISCQTQSEEIQLEDTSASLINRLIEESEYPVASYNGLIVLDRFGVLTDDEKTTKQQQRSNHRNSSTDFEVMLNNEPGLMYVMNEIKPELPYFYGSKQAIPMIQADFPELITDELIEANIEIIDEYYSLALEQRFVEVYEENFKLVAVDDEIRELPMRTSTNEDDDEYHNTGCLRAETGWSNDTAFGRANSIRTVFTLNKAADAVEIAADRYPNVVENNTKRDAFRQIVWVGLLQVHWPSYSSVTRLMFATQISERSEVCRVNSEPAKEMDFHNNQVGIDSFQALAEGLSRVEMGQLRPQVIEAAAFEIGTGVYIDGENLTDEQIITEITTVVPEYRAVWYDSSLINPPNCPDGYVTHILSGQCCRHDIIFGVLTYYDCID